VFSPFPLIKPRSLSNFRVVDKNCVIGNMLIRYNWHTRIMRKFEFLANNLGCFMLFSSLWFLVCFFIFVGVVQWLVAVLVSVTNFWN
jgi:hypothetical protein